MLGPGGRSSYEGYFSSEIIFREFTLLSLDDIREFRLECRALDPTELHLSSFPSLEVLVVDPGACASTLSTVVPDPASSSLKTLVFTGSLITEGFMTELIRSASDRENTASASLNRVAIIDQSNGYPPTVFSFEIGRLTRHVSVVEVMEGMGLPKDLL